MNSLIELNSFSTLSSRECGALARAKLLEALSVDDALVVVDFGLRSMSPSFADECIGVLVQRVGFDAFKERIRMKNVSPSAQILIKHVISKRQQSRQVEGGFALA